MQQARIEEEKEELKACALEAIDRLVYLNAETYAATLCGYTYELTTSEHGWHIEVHGFSDKLPPLLVKLCSSLKALADAPHALCRPEPQGHHNARVRVKGWGLGLRVRGYVSG